MYRGALVSGFVNISVYFNKLLLDRFFKKNNILLVIRADILVSHFFVFRPTVAEMILERYAEIYSNQFTTGKSPFQSVQCSTVLTNTKL